MYMRFLQSVMHLIPLGPSGDLADPLVAKIHRAEGITSSDQPFRPSRHHSDRKCGFDVTMKCVDQHFLDHICNLLLPRIWMFHYVSLLKSPKSAANLANCFFWLTRETSHGQLGSAAGGRRAQLVFQQLHGDLTSGDWRNGLDVFIKWI